MMNKTLLLSIALAFAPAMAVTQKPGKISRAVSAVKSNPVKSGVGAAAVAGTGYYVTSKYLAQRAAKKAAAQTAQPQSFLSNLNPFTLTSDSAPVVAPKASWMGYAKSGLQSAGNGIVRAGKSAGNGIVRAGKFAGRHIATGSSSVLAQAKAHPYISTGVVAGTAAVAYYNRAAIQAGASKAKGYFSGKANVAAKKAAPQAVKPVAKPVVKKAAPKKVAAKKAVKPAHKAVKRK